MTHRVLQILCLIAIGACQPSMTPTNLAPQESSEETKNEEDPWKDALHVHGVIQVNPAQLDPERSNAIEFFPSSVLRVPLDQPNVQLPRIKAPQDPHAVATLLLLPSKELIHSQRQIQIQMTDVVEGYLQIVSQSPAGEPGKPGARGNAGKDGESGQPATVRSLGPALGSQFGNLRCIKPPGPGGNGTAGGEGSRGGDGEAGANAIDLQVESVENSAKHWPLRVTTLPGKGGVGGPGGTGGPGGKPGAAGFRGPGDVCPPARAGAPGATGSMGEQGSSGPSGNAGAITFFHNAPLQQ